MPGKKSPQPPREPGGPFGPFESLLGCPNPEFFELIVPLGSDDFDEELLASFGQQTEQLTQNLESLSTEQLDELVAAAKQITLKEFADVGDNDEALLAHVRKLSWSARRRLGQHYARKFVEFGFAIPPIVILLLNIGLLVTKVIQLILAVRKLRREQRQLRISATSSTSLPSNPSSTEEGAKTGKTEEANEPLGLRQPEFEFGQYEGLMDRVVPWLADKAIPAIMKFIPQYLEQKRDVLVAIVINSLQSALERLIDNLINEMRNKYQDLT